MFRSRCELYYQIFSCMVNNRDTVFHSYIQMQTGSNDCDLFAVVYATAVTFVDDFGHCVFNQQRMRAHLHYCFLSGMLTPFKAIRVRNIYDIAGSVLFVSSECDVLSHCSTLLT